MNIVTVTLGDGRVYPSFEGETLSWCLGLYNTLAEERAGYPRMRAVIRAMREYRPAELRHEVRETLRASFGIFAPSAERTLRVLYEVLVVESESAPPGETMAERFMRRRAAAVDFGVSVPREGLVGWHEDGASATYTLSGEFFEYCTARINVELARRDYLGMKSGSSRVTCACGFAGEPHLGWIEHNGQPVCPGCQEGPRVDAA